jgi:hypothetical protein
MLLTPTAARTAQRGKPAQAYRIVIAWRSRLAKAPDSTLLYMGCGKPDLASSIAGSDRRCAGPNLSCIDAVASAMVDLRLTDRVLERTEPAWISESKAPGTNLVPGLRVTIAKTPQPRIECAARRRGAPWCPSRPTGPGVTGATEAATRRRPEPVVSAASGGYLDRGAELRPLPALGEMP